MLGWRLIVSAILIPALVGLFYFDAKAGNDALILLVFCVFLAVRGAWEMADLLRTRSFEPSFRLTGLLSVAIVVAAWGAWHVIDEGSGIERSESIEVSFHGWSVLPRDASSGVYSSPWECVALTLSASVLILLLNRALRYREPGKSMETLGAELLIVSYIGLLLAVTAQLRWVNGELGGYLALSSLIVAAKCGDIGAYTLGRLFGKKKMVPLLSPGKTWMGALGAVGGAALGSVLWLTLAPSLFSFGWRVRPLVWSVLFGAIIGVVGLIGDLCESLIKRDVGRKDSASLLPGFGGLLDLLDSVLYSGPVAYILWRTLPL